MPMIRAGLVVLVLSSIAAIDARPAAAEIYRPWCVEYLGGAARIAASTRTSNA